MDLEQQIRPETSFRVTPRLIQSTHILALSSLELSQALVQEMQENPAFEVEELPSCGHCGSVLVNGRCLHCPPDRAEDGTRDASGRWDREEEIYGSTQRHEFIGAEDADTLTQSSAPEQLADALLYALRPLLVESEWAIGEYLVGCLDERGFLTISVDEAAMALRVPVAQVEQVLAALQTLDPPGVGARTLEECLLVQLQALADQEAGDPLAEAIVRGNHLRQIAHRRWREVAEALNCTVGEVKRAWQFIRERLTPFPANGFHPGVEEQRPQPIRPDVIIRQQATGDFDAEVVEASRYELKINESYLACYQQELREALDPEERAHVREHVLRARFFTDCVRQRWETLRRITLSLIECQREFLERGARYLVPLTRSELAMKIGLHESTVSRATSGKYALLPDGRTVSFDDFFDASLRIKNAMWEILQEEDDRAPLSDQHIAERLRAYDFAIARRTVAKYRDALRILPSRYRY